ncbi:MAG: PIN domain-containing protein [Anaerolineales bacterium]|nr:PIN domain-containing protein [Anaerolineales bacterium]
MKISAKLKNVHRIFLDTAPVIYFIEKNPNYLQKVKVVFEHLDDGTLAGVASPVTLSECLVLPFRLGRSDLAQSFMQILSNSSTMTFVVIDDQIASQAADLRARYNLTLSDAFQVAAALAADCDAFLTNDDTLKRVTELNAIVLDEVEAG